MPTKNRLIRAKATKKSLSKSARPRPNKSLLRLKNERKMRQAKEISMVLNRANLSREFLERIAITENVRRVLLKIIGLDSAAMTKQLFSLANTPQVIEELKRIAGVVSPTYFRRQKVVSAPVVLEFKKQEDKAPVMTRSKSIKSEKASTTSKISQDLLEAIWTPHLTSESVELHESIRKNAKSNIEANKEFYESFKLKP